jgi:alpha-tubulin suppressor-like RCC1 family protein
VSVGDNQAAAIKADGTLWLWGSGGNGQLGDDTAVSKSSPVQTITGGTDWKQVSCGYTHVAAIKTDNTLWLWGSNFTGGLGVGAAFNSKSSPVQTVAGGTNWKQVSCGRGQTAAIKTDSTLWTWGSNANGQLGNNLSDNTSSPAQTVCGGTDWKQVSCGYTRTSAIKLNGELWSWGLNDYGQLGDGTITMRSSPVQTIAGGADWKQVSCSSFSTAAIKTDGTLWLWGRNSNGQLGINSTSSRSSPVQTIAGGTNWKQVSAGETHTATIKTDGTLWLWGANTIGQLGTNGGGSKSSPVQTIAGGTNWKQVSCWNQSTAAIKDFDEYYNA